MTIRDKLLKIQQDINESANLLPSSMAKPLWLVDGDIDEILADLDACQRSWKEELSVGEKTWFRMVPDPNPDADE